MKALPASAILLCLVTAACTTPAGYPDLAIREGERVTGTLAPPEAEPYMPDPVAPATIAQLDMLLAAARAAHARFDTAAAAARGTVTAARGTNVGSENWAQAQVVIADLEAMRSAVMIALADIDRIYVDAAVSGDAVAPIAQAQGEVNAMVDSENAIIDSYLDTLGS